MFVDDDIIAAIREHMRIFVSGVRTKIVGASGRLPSTLKIRDVREPPSNIRRLHH